MNEMHVVDLGLVEYRRAWELQRRLVDRRARDEVPDLLLLLEHPHVITLGRRGRMDDVLDASVPVISVERGGEATYHGPGQLVGYPIMRLADRLDVKRYVRDIEEVLIRASRVFGLVSGHDVRQSGVWVHGRKLGSIGIAIHHNITYHGFAHNVNTDLTYFQKIRPCGFDGSIMTSMERELGHRVPMGTVKDAITSAFAEVFAMEVLLEQEIPDGVLEVSPHPSPGRS